MHHVYEGESEQTGAFGVENLRISNGAAVFQKHDSECVAAM